MHKKIPRSGIVSMLILILISPLFVFAARLGSGEEYTLGRNETVNENLYVAAGNVVVAGNASKDLLAAGGDVMASGEIGEDLVAIGGNVSLTGRVGDDARIVGGQVIVGNEIRGDLAAAGGMVRILRDAKIGGDAMLAGGRIFIEGDMGGKLNAAAGEITINGIVDGDVMIGSQKVIIGKDAVIRGSLSYSSPIRAEISNEATIDGEVQFNQTSMGRDEIRNTFAGFLGFVGIVRLLSAIVVVVLLAIFLKRPLSVLSEKTMDSFGTELVRGLIVFLVIPVVVIILFLTLAGAAAGGIVLLAYLLLVALSMFVDAIIFGSWISKVVLKKERIEVTWINSIVGVLLLSVISLIPIIGWIFGLIFFLAAFGVLSNSIWLMFKAR